MINLYLTSAAAVITYMIIIFIIAQIKKDNSIVDIGWGPGFLLIALTLLSVNGKAGYKELILTGMILLWSLRLALHIFYRSRGKSEDFRYAQWRKDWGEKAVINAFIRVFMLQGILMLIIAIPIVIVFNDSSGQLTIFNYIGLIIFVFGFSFESIGDYQLVSFKKNPGNKGKIITSGLWKITRHPNYFGEAVLWWGIGLFTIGSEFFLFALIGPLFLNLLLLYVSGVPMLEKKYDGNPDWEKYKKQTPMFIPFFGRKG